jgi:uncharacterized protein with von Willebrand factor type A (vWA) domain
MRYRYGQYDGQPFPTQDMLFPSPQIVQFILQYGDKALKAMENVDGDEEQQYVQALIDAGLLERDEGSGQLKLTPKMVRGIEHRSLLEVFEGLRKGQKEGHDTTAPGAGDERTEGSKAYEFGDRFSELDLAATMRNALHRLRSGGGGQDADDHASMALPIRIDSRDFEVHRTEGQADCATCVLIDLSGSMMRYGRFLQAKRVALGMCSMIRRRFPQDTIDFVGFYSLADRIAEKDLPLIMPKPVTVYDHQVRLRVPLEQAREQPKMVPQHFTNLHLGLRLARQILRRRGAANRQIFVITDGQPTAHVEAIEGAGGQDEMLYLLYPPTQRTADVTLKEALRCQQQDIRVATFALVEDYWGMDWVGFVDQLTRLTRGTAFYCSSEDLSSTVIESYLRGRRRRSFVA